MCHKVPCSTCGKYNWVGCGLHIAMAMKGVEEKDRCPNWKKGGACSGAAAEGK